MPGFHPSHQAIHTLSFPAWKYLCLPIFIFLNTSAVSQPYFSIAGGGINQHDVMEIGNCYGFNVAPFGGGVNSGFTLTIDTHILVLNLQNNSFEINDVNIDTDFWTSLIVFPMDVTHLGLVATADGLVYTTREDDLIQVDLTTGTVTNLGAIDFFHGEMCLFNGEIYIIEYWFDNDNRVKAIRKLNTAAPSSSEVVWNCPVGSFRGLGITASEFCGTLILTSHSPNPGAYFANLIEGTLTEICNTTLYYMASMHEFQSPPCPVFLDLDEDDSSGATESDFFPEPFTCLSAGAPIADEDIITLYDAVIQEMTIEIVGFMPDAPLEVLEMIASVPGIMVDGAGTSKIVLTNGGSANGMDFREALQAIRYENNAQYPAGGQRSIEVQFTTGTGAQSNIATAFVDVVELPVLEVDLGPDTSLCNGATLILDAENPGVSYDWSTGQSSQTIAVSDAGEYSVTISNATHCPGADTIFVEFLEVDEIDITGLEEICANEEVQVMINITSNNPYSFTILINSQDSLQFDNVTGSVSFDYPVMVNSVFEIIDASTTAEVCFILIDSVHEVVLLPVYNIEFEETLCNTDSLLFDGDWLSVPGTYQATFFSMDGCDSTVVLTLGIVNGIADTTFLTLSDCNAADTGTTIQVLTNLAGCDSLIISRVEYVQPIITVVDSFTCDSSLQGTYELLLLDANGCDSLVVTRIMLRQPDTTFTAGYTCDIQQAGMVASTFQDAAGCDSVSIAVIAWLAPDTTLILTTSCDPGSVGESVLVLANQYGCDSVIIRTVLFAEADSTYLFGTTCDPAQAGTEILFLENGEGCDSLVFLTLSFVERDTVYLSGTTCHAQDSGMFIQHLTNQFGCDSIVIETITLLPASFTQLNSTTCNAAEAGVFTTTLINHLGCDSIITHFVTLINADTTWLQKRTCLQEETGLTEHYYTAVNGCDSLVIEEILLHDLPAIGIDIASDYNGAAISCYGSSDGSLAAIVTGVEPFFIAWSTGSDDNFISGLAAGQYGVTATDGNGCITAATITLTEPGPLQIGLEISQPDCFEHTNGLINVIAHGGVGPYSYGINDGPLVSSPVFNNLPGGAYDITTIDANLCSVQDIVLINVPLMVNVEVGDDTEISVGDTVTIIAIVNVPYDSLASVTWSGLQSPACPTCLTQVVAPVITTTYMVQVMNQDGCEDSDAITLSLSVNADLYIPNVFSPNGDGINDVFTIYSHGSIKSIMSFSIYDRWGNQVHSNSNVLPNSKSLAWDGTFRGEPLDPAVFAYKAFIELQDGSVEVRYGDITLIR